MLSSFAGGVFVCRKCMHMTMGEIKQYMLDTAQYEMYKYCIEGGDAKQRILLKEDDHEMLQMSKEYENEF